MKASAIEFRLRIWIQFIIVAIAIWAPWVQPWNLKLRISTLEWLALQMGRSGVVTFAVAVPIVIVFGSLLAALAAGLRVCGTAYLGSDIMQHGEMQARGVVAAGPYRYVRNPLYLGTWLMMMAISLLLTPSGALFLIAVSAFFFVRKILGEEAFLANKLGEPYQQYLRAVPRILPKLRPVIAPADTRAHWITAIITELMPIGTLITMAVVPWTYDNTAALEGILISFVVSLIVRGLMKSPLSTCVFLAVVGASWGLVHLSIERSALIGFGAALVTWAVMPRRPANPAPTSDAQ